jgi:methionine-S-sulfoxide reductase
LSTVVGYTGGSTPDPTYQAIGDHTEALRVEFDPTRVSYEELVDKFWREHDPMPFAMVGYQYQSAVWHHTPYQEAVVAAVKARLDDGSPSASARDGTAQAPAASFYRAEEYHQNFILKQTGGVRMI